MLFDLLVSLFGFLLFLLLSGVFCSLFVFFRVILFLSGFLIFIVFLVRSSSCSLVSILLGSLLIIIFILVSLIFSFCLLVFGDWARLFLGLLVFICSWLSRLVFF